MYRKRTMQVQTLKGNKTYLGETIENKVRRVLNNNEPIKDTAPLIYTERKDGVLPDYDMRTDKYEHLVEGFDALAKSKRAKSDGVAGAQKALDVENQKLRNEKGEKGTDKSTAEPK